MTTVDDFRSRFDGVRANRYSVNTPFPSGIDAGDFAVNSEIYIKALSVPGSQIGMIPVSFQGRQIKFSGERQFSEWAVTVYDSAKGLRRAFENWMNAMDHHETHAINYNLTNTWEVKYNDGIIGQQGHPGGSLGANYRFKLHHVWPIDISPIDLSYDLVDSFAEFTITLAYDRHEPIGG